MEGAVAGLIDDLPEIEEATSPSVSRVVMAAGKKPMKQPRVEKALKGAKSVRGGNVQRTGGKVPRKTLGKKRPMVAAAAAARVEEEEEGDGEGEGEDGEVGVGPKKKIRDGTEVAVDRLAKAQEAVIREERNAVTAVSKALAKRVRNTILDTATKDKIERVIRTIRDRVAPETAVMKTSDFEKFTAGGFDRGERVRMFRFVLQKGQSNKSTNTLEILSVEGILKPEPGGVRVALVLRCGKRGANDEDEEEDELDFEKPEGVKRLVKFAHSYTNKKYKPIPVDGEDGTGELIGDEEEVDLDGMSNDQCNLVRNNFLVNMATQLCWLQKSLDATMRPPGQYISTHVLRRIICDRMEA